jgi:isopentenyl-diphosphate delta-isomerase
MSHQEPTPPRQVILCDEAGRPTGTADILEAHTGTGRLHLAFSVYVFKPDWRSILVQERAPGKMLWPHVWANTCCSHPRAGEAPVDAGRRRLREELGMDCDLEVGPAFVYRAEDPAGRGVEREFDILLFGTSNADPVPDPNEVAAWQWMNVDALRKEMGDRPELYAPWFHRGLPIVLAHLQGRSKK